MLGSLSLPEQFTLCNMAAGSDIPNIAATRTGAALTLLAVAGQAGGYKYSPSDSSYTIKFPGKPQENTQTVETALGPIKVLYASFEANQGKRAYIASSTRYKIDPRRYNVQKGLDGARDGMVQQTHGKVVKETRITYKGAPGREIYLTVAQGKAKVRIYVVNGAKGPTVYQAVIIDAGGKVDDAAATAFLGSLTFPPR